MIGYRVDTARSTPVKSTAGSLPVRGQFDGGVGCIPNWERRQRRLERISQIPPLHSLGNVGSPGSAPTLQVGDTVAHCTPFMHHRICGELPVEGGRNSISRSLPPFVGNSPDLLGLADSPACQTHSVLSECDSRQSITLQASVHGVADRPLSF